MCVRGGGGDGWVGACVCMCALFEHLECVYTYGKTTHHRDLSS